MNCGICLQTIEEERLAILPTTPFCSSCAKTQKAPERRGFLAFDHKTGGTIQIVSKDFYDANKKYFIPNGARSCVKNFSRNICA